MKEWKGRIEELALELTGQFSVLDTPELVYKTVMNLLQRR